ncbi:hypothetical protein C8J57DRAFT_1502998 [Mycena rebaudengoi]|nr:hypothetical protein C8J57DRAFT_1502998 [Mycena rebaudengoi]
MSPFPSLSFTTTTSTNGAHGLVHRLLGARWVHGRHQTGLISWDDKRPQLIVDAEGHIQVIQSPICAGFDPEGRHMKHEIIARTRGHIPLSPPQKKWLGQFVPPLRAPQHPDGSYAKRTIARLKSRKAKLDHLEALRHAPRRAGIPPPIIVWKPAMVVESRVEREQREREERQGAVREAERQQAAQARKASVDHLTALRHAPRPAGIPPPIIKAHVAKPDMDFSCVGMARGPPRLRNLAPLPSDIYLEISHHVDRPTLAAFNRASTETRDATRPTLYRHIEVLDTACLLVRTLGNNSTLSAMVRSLRFTATRCAWPTVVGPEWNQALIAMIHLKNLSVEQHVHMDSSIIHLICFRLNSFSAGGALAKAWDTFLRAQLEVKSLVILGWPILLAGDVPTTFAHLEHVSATTHQATSFLAIYPLKSVRLLVPFVIPSPIPPHTLERFARLPATVVKLHMISSQFLLVNAAGPWLLALEELILDEGEAHWNYRLAEVKSLALELKAVNVPRLSSLRLVSRDLMYSSRRDLVAAAIRERCDLMTLRTFTLCSMLGCTQWCNWGAEEETAERVVDCELDTD